LPLTNPLIKKQGLIRLYYKRGDRQRCAKKIVAASGLRERRKKRVKECLRNSKNRGSEELAL